MELYGNRSKRELTLFNIKVKTAAMEKSEALKEIAKGGSIVFVGYILLGGFDFLYKVVVARYLSPAGYGLLFLGFAVTGFAVTISRLGFAQAFQKFIPEYRTKGSPEKVRGLIFLGLTITLIVGLLFTFSVYFLSEKISVTLFGTHELIPVLRTLSFAVPAYAVTYLFFSLFLSFKKPKEGVFLETVVRAGLTLVLTGIVIFLGGDLHDVCYVYVLSFVAAAVVGLFILDTRIFPATKKGFHIEYSRIVSFSVPLIFVGFLREIMHWSDSFFIGHFSGEYYVGLYNAAHPVAYILLLVILSLNSLFFPVASELYTKGNTKDLREVYITLTRWIFMVTFPLFLLLGFFAEDFLTVLFGANYSPAHNALLILCFGTFVNAFFGAVGVLLQVYEKQNFIFKVQFMAAVLNVILNTLLIPVYGIEGAACATAASMIFWNVAYFFKVKRILKIQYDFNYYKRYVCAAFGSLLLVYGIYQLFTQHIVVFAVEVLLFFIVYFFVLLVTKSFSREDIELLLLVEKKTGLNLNAVKKVIKMLSKM